MPKQESFLKRAITFRQECIKELKSLCGKKEIILWEPATEEMLNRETFDEDEHNEKLAKLPTGMSFPKHYPTMYWAVTGVRVKGSQVEFQFADDEEGLGDTFWGNIGRETEIDISLQNLARLVDILKEEKVSQRIDDTIV